VGLPRHRSEKEMTEMGLESWQRAVLEGAESAAYTAPADRATQESIGDAIHHVLGHTEEQWQFHLEHCTRPLCRAWAIGDSDD
jgi:hypothetical protein